MNFIQNWINLGASKFVLETIENVYKISFIDTPTSFIASNNKSAFDYHHFVSEAVNELLQQKCVEEIPERPDIINQLSISIQGQKKRLILDLRHVNKFIYKQHFKCEDIRTII